jgi:hypothetical protein
MLLAPEPNEFTRTSLRYNEACRQIRAAAAQEAGEAYEAQLRRIEPKKVKLGSEIAQYGEKMRELAKRHHAEVQAISSKREKANRALSDLLVPSVTYDQLLNSPERLAELERLKEEEISETIPVGTGVTAKDVLRNRRRLAAVRRWRAQAPIWV